MTRLANTLLALLNLKLIVSWDRTCQRALLQPTRWLAQVKSTKPLPSFRVVSARSWTASLSIGSGSGYVQSWYGKLGRGPGAATGSGQEDYGKKSCGHAFPYHCNSAFCGNAWCNAQRWPVFGALFVLGITWTLAWNAKHFEHGVKRGLQLYVNGRGAVPDGSGCWKSLCFYGRRDRTSPPYVLATPSAA